MAHRHTPERRKPYPDDYIHYVNVEDGTLAANHVHRDTHGNDTFNMTRNGVDDGLGHGFRITSSVLNTTSSENYTEEDDSQKTWRRGYTDPSIVNSNYQGISIDEGSLVDDETHTGRTTSTTQQFVTDVPHANDSG